MIIERAAVTAVATAWDTALLDPANAGTPMSSLRR